VAVTILSRPEGHKLDTTLHDAVIYDDGAGNALVYTSSAHTLSDGDVVYIESNFDSYNGFKYVDSIAYDYFKIRDSENSDYTSFVQEADISFYISLLQHGWQCVHLPIVYELESDIAPTNNAEESYAPTVVVSQENIDGYTRLNLSAALSFPHELSYIELVGTGPLAGKYQLTNIAYPWSVDLDLAYDAANVFTPYQVVRYYNNYFVSVDVYAGFESGHRWESVKPMELAATLKLIPDSNNRIKFSIAEVLRGYIETRNNLTLDTLPNNTDFHVSFYIAYNENYDIGVDGEYVEVFSDEVTTDDFIGHAVNAMLPFKSLNMSFLSDYIDGEGVLARWLTIQDRPVAIVGHFFDLSFLLQYSGFDLEVTIYKSFEGSVTDTEVVSIPNPGVGVIRVPFIPESGYDQYCIQAATVGEAIVLLSEFSNSGSGVTWATGTTPSVTLTASQISKIISAPFSFISGATYTVSGAFSFSGTASSATLFARIYNGAFVTQESDSNFIGIGSGSGTYSVTFVADADTVRIGFAATMGAIPNSKTINIETINIEIEPRAVTEQICIDIIEECGNTLTNDDLRITEDTELRRLE